MNYEELHGSGAEGEVYHAMWYKKDVAVMLFEVIKSSDAKKKLSGYCEFTNDANHS